MRITPKEPVEKETERTDRAETGTGRETVKRTIYNTFVVLGCATALGALLYVVAGQSPRPAQITQPVDFLRGATGVFLVVSSIGLYIHGSYLRWVHYPWPIYLFIAGLGFSFVLDTVSPSVTTVPAAGDPVRLFSSLLLALMSAFAVTTLLTLSDEELARMPYTPLSVRGIKERKKREEAAEEGSESLE